jgi:hypothetical protein
VTESELPLFCIVIVVVKAKEGDVLMPVNVAVQLPFTLLELEPPFPQLAAVIMTSARVTIAKTYFM